MTARLAKGLSGIALGLLLLGGCGVKGQLAPASPLFGDRGREPPEKPVPFPEDESEEDDVLGRVPSS